MSQGMKYRDEESIKEIIISYTCHTTMNALSKSIYKENQRTYKAIQKTGNQDLNLRVKFIF
jgi:hypothetical protein